MENKHFILIAAMSLVLCVTSSCGSTRKGLVQETSKSVMVNGIDSRHSNKYKYVVKTVVVKPFTAISNKGVARITFCKGNECKVEMRGSKRALDNSRLHVKGNTLVLNKETSLSMYGTQVEYIIYCPKITRISNEGSLTMSVGNMVSDNLEISNSGVLRLDCGKLSCDGGLKIDNRGQCDMMNFKNISAGDMMFDNVGVIRLSANEMRCNTLKLRNNGQVAMFKGNVSSSRFDMKNNGVMKCDTNISGTDMHIQNQGQADITAHFVGKSANVYNSGIGNIFLTVDCSMLDARNSGQCDLDISGTADSTDISGTGISRINTRRLNNF